VTVAALYIDPRGPYPTMAGVDAWDATRDARKYDGPWPVVAHPPCGPWGSLQHLSRKDSPLLALRAVEQVRAWGGVLEHPARSGLWAYYELPLPGAPPDEFGGYTIEVTQVEWGHVARKRTWLYLVGVAGSALAPPPLSGQSTNALDRCLPSLGRTPHEDLPNERQRCSARHQGVQRAAAPEDSSGVR
jgi:hypothetical protein